jgi:hypothetical protein
MTAMTKVTTPYADGQAEDQLGNPLVSGSELWRALGYRTATAFSQAARRGTVPIRVFSLPGRRGQHALRADVVAWQSQVKQLAQSPINHPKEGPMP